MEAQPELFVVVGPNGSGKSSAIYETQINDKLIFVNPDDIAAQEYPNAEDPSINIERIAQRHAKGGHTVPDQKVISRYHRTLELLKDYFETADEAFVWDNSTTSDDAANGGMKELVRKIDGEIEVLDAALSVRWVNDFLLDAL